MSDPRIVMTADGSSLQFIGGQPLMDDGLENLVLISLFSGKTWCGDTLIGQQIGSDFEEKCGQPVTRTSLNEIRNAAELALKNPLFGKVIVTVSNPQSYRLLVKIVIQPPGKTPLTLSLFRSGGAWYYQSVDPAYRKIVDLPIPYKLNTDFILNESTLS